MPSNVIVAVFSTTQQADRAVSELEADGISRASIHQFDQKTAHMPDDDAGMGTTASTATTAPSASGTQGSGFWGWLFGDESTTSADHRVYDDVVTNGGIVVSVTAPETEHDRVISILERCSPIDLDDHSRTVASSATAAGMATGTTAGMTTGAAAKAATTPSAVPAAAGEQVIALAEEELQVGKRMVETGRTRIRRYVVETPVEERVRLRTERVVVERRRRMSGDTLSPDAFTETTTEAIEREEVPVVAKTAHVGEEVVVRTESAERDQVVKDTVRREEVEVTHDNAAGTVPSTGTGAPTARPGAL